MSRKIIQIEEDKCIGCGLCESACQESAIKVIDGKAKLVREDYCDGLGNCLPVCPTDAIHFIETDKPRAVKPTKTNETKQSGCPGSMSLSFDRKPNSVEGITAQNDGKTSQPAEPLVSQLRQWPVQIKLVSETASFFDNARLLIAADCAAYSYANFHNDFIKDRVVIIGCPKLDEGDYSEKLTTILRENNIKSVTIVRMEVPCCAGLVEAAKVALQNCGKLIPWRVVIVSVDGQITEE